MDTIYGVLVLWNNKAGVDFENVKDTDYALVKAAEFPRQDGEPLEGLPENYEWLENCIPFAAPDYDPRLFVLNESIQPTNIPHPVHPNYNQYRTTYSLVRRADELIIASVRQEEASANNSLLTEAENSKLNYFATGAALTLAQNLPLSEAEQNAMTRHADVQMKMSKNAANADLIISKIIAKENIDISSGWEKDNIAEGGFPFAPMA